MAVEDLEGVSKRRQELQAELAEQEKQQSVLLDEKEQVNTQLGSWQNEMKELSLQEEKLHQQRKELQSQIKQTTKTQTELEKKELALQQNTDQLKQELIELDRMEKEFEEELVLAKERREKDQAWAKEQQQRQQEARKEIQQQQEQEQKRRQSQRSTLEIDVSIQTDHNFFMGLTENISEGGLFVATYDELPLGTELDLRLNLPDSSPIETKAVVVWVREQNWFSEDVVPGVGVRFHDLSEEHASAIRKFVEKREPMFYEADDMADPETKHP